MYFQKMAKFLLQLPIMEIGITEENIKKGF